MKDNNLNIRDITNRSIEKLQEIVAKYPKVEMVSSTNERFNYQGRVGKLVCEKGCISFYSRGLAYDFRTSYIVKVELQKDILVFTTRNSVYSFKVLERVEEEAIEDFDKELFSLSPDEIDEIENYIKCFSFMEGVI